MVDYLIPLFLVLLGLIGLTIYVLTIALRDSTRQVSKMNERLLIILGVKDGGEQVGRALVASAKPPAKVIPGVSEKKEEPKKGFKVVVGSR